MSSDLETFRPLITCYYCGQKLDEGKTVQHLEEEEFTTNVFTIHTCLEQSNLIPSPSLKETYPSNHNPATAIAVYEQEQEQERYAPQHMYGYHDTGNETYYHESSLRPNNPVMGPTPMERFAQEDHPYERIALGLPSLVGITSRERTTPPPSPQSKSSNSKPHRTSKANTPRKKSKADDRHAAKVASETREGTDRRGGLRRKK